MPRVMTHTQLEEVKAYFRAQWEEATRFREEREREYRERYGLRKPTEKELEDALKGKNKKAYGKNGGIAWDYPDEIYEGRKTFRMPK